MASPHPGNARRTPLAIGISIALLAVGGLIAVRMTYGYLLFRSIVEVFAIAIAAGMFMITWNLRRFFDSGYLLVLAIGFFAAAFVDTLHVFAYAGMEVFPGATADLPTQLWIAARYLEAAALVIAPLYARRPASAVTVLAGFSLATLALLSIILVPDTFPDAFVPALGLTPFSIYSEVAIAAVMLVGLLAVYVHRSTFTREVYLLLSAAIVAAIAAELSFTLYADPDAVANFIGHLLKVVTFFLLYRAVVETVLVTPFDVLFGDLKRVTRELGESEARFRTTFERATVGIAHIDLSGRWIRFNARLPVILGYEPDELEYHRIEDITHPEDRLSERPLIDRLAAGEIDEYQLEKRLIAKDGSTAWVETSRTLLRDDHGSPRYFIATFEGIDERKAAEEELRRSRDLTEAINSIDVAINTTFDISEIARIAAEEGCRALGAESAVVLMLRGRRWMTAHAYNFPGQPPAADEPWVDLGSATLLSSPDAYDDPRLDHAFTRRWSIRALLALPLSFSGEALGVIYFLYHSAPHRFSEPEMQFARALATSVAIAVESSRRYQTQRAIADALQSSFLDMPKRVPGLDIAHAYSSATELARIGGDFYDVFDVGDETVAFVLGDVSGKGLEASTLTVMAKSTIRAFAYQNHRPAHVMGASNDAIAAQIEESRFITAVYGTIDITTGRLRMACAGHPAPLLCVGGACIEHTLQALAPLGVVPHAVFPEYETVLMPDTLLILFSDGLVEARRGSSFLGEERVARRAEAAAGAGPQSVVEALVQEAENHTGGRIEDDVAIVVLRYLGSQSEQLSR